jgi:peptide chain release factor
MKIDDQLALLITSGNGPAECQIAAAHVLAKMKDEAKVMSVKIDVNATTSKHGVKSAVAIVSGTNCAMFSARWRGTVQWVAKSPVRPNHKRQNWFVAVTEVVAKSGAIQGMKLSDIKFESFRAGGPGGQHQNTTDSAVRATHCPSGVSAVAREMRSQHRNKALAIERLALLLQAQVASDHAAEKQAQNRQHNMLLRGNPVRKFKGTTFREVVMK